MRPTSGNKTFRRIIVSWAMILISVVVILTWINPPDIPTGTATALGVIVGLLATAIGLYQWSRSQDDKMSQVYEDRK